MFAVVLMVLLILFVAWFYAEVRARADTWEAQRL